MKRGSEGKRVKGKEAARGGGGKKEGRGWEKCRREEGREGKREGTKEGGRMRDMGREGVKREG